MPAPSFEPYDTLNNKTYYGLLIAEFLAAFNDQCIHASAMFFAISTQTLTESGAISLMPLLFYTPWAIFAPLSGYLADRYSKRSSLIFWKIAEVGITLLALVGFWLGSTFTGTLGDVGPWLVMSTVFLMGTHSAFFVPNKYGVLPEIFTVRMLSRANGLIESTTFLAVILGTTIGGLLSHTFRGQEAFIGLILVVLALIGTLTSLLIRRIPPADPNRPFPGLVPWKHYQPMLQNLKALLKSRLTSVAVLGLAFFTFMVAYMRATMYMFGESQNPRWDEQQTSLMVAVVSLGVGLGSPLAGYISGGKIELGLVPIGAAGMIFALVLASLSIFSVGSLVVALILIGLFSSFYLVPLYSLLQYGAPKGSKGTSVATNNFICVTGAIIASVVFFTLVAATRWTGLAEPVNVKDIGQGVLLSWSGERHHPSNFRVRLNDSNEFITVQAHPENSSKGQPTKQGSASVPENDDRIPPKGTAAAENIIKINDNVQKGTEVIVSKFTLRDINYFQLRPANEPPHPIYNQERIPHYLFLAAALLMLTIFVILSRRLPDFVLRSLLWLRFLFRPVNRVEGQDKLPAGPVIALTNCSDLEQCFVVIAGMVRPVRFLIPNQKVHGVGTKVLAALAREAGMLFIDTANGADELVRAIQSASRSLRQGYLVAISMSLPRDFVDSLLIGVQKAGPYPLVTLTCAKRPATAKFGTDLTDGSLANEISAIYSSYLLQQGAT